MSNNLTDKEKEEVRFYYKSNWPDDPEPDDEMLLAISETFGYATYKFEESLHCVADAFKVEARTLLKWLKDNYNKRKGKDEPK